MREFDSRGLADMARVLGISTGQPQLVEIQDQILEQAIGLNPFLRRALAPAGSGGLFTASILNTHVGSDTITTDVDPYEPGTTFVGGGYPAVVSSIFDVWLLGLHSENITGGGDFGGGFFGVITDALGMGWRNEANAVAVIQLAQVYSLEGAIGNRSLLSTTAGLSLTSNQVPLPFRIRRGRGTFRFETVKTGVGAATYKAFLTLGVFPAGMGQDGVSL